MKQLNIFFFTKICFKRFTLLIFFIVVKIPLYSTPHIIESPCLIRISISRGFPVFGFLIKFHTLFCISNSGYFSFKRFRTLFSGKDETLYKLHFIPNLDNLDLALLILLKLKYSLNLIKSSTVASPFDEKFCIKIQQFTPGILLWLLFSLLRLL